ncbi:unnamed protein product [Danaus chrysippus]|uniref:(African queen) hypothetical protein n=1 Tax=Danaus chrysippus TaxID=151541 RepID=A0A8J2QU48_9NEOP|nr:unnamed protein product [Danaus chrysippus]
MIHLYSIVSVCTLFNLFSTSLCLKRLPPIEENNIAATEAIIRYTINKLFLLLKLNGSVKAKSQDYSKVHKYFTSLTLQDNDNLKEIAKQTRVSYKNINETDFIAIINDVLAEGTTVNENNEENESDENVTHYIEQFLRKLQLLKEMYSVDKVYTNINMDVLKAMNKNDKSSNVTYDSFKIVGNNTTTEESEFWESSGRRIFKGERTKIKHFPFMATIQIFNNFHCAGSIIKSDLIITASSCLQLAYNNRLFRENPAFLSARVGSSFYNGGGEVISVQEVYFHPSYDPKTLRNNICLLRLSRHLKFRRKIRSVKKIDFDRHESTLSMTTSGITIVGWGAKEHSPIIGSPWKNIISFAELHVYPLEDCQDVYSKAYVTKKNFCAGFISRGGGACNRDVGGPGIVENKLMGIISFGSPVCGSPDMPTVFTKVGYYTDWIEEIMEQPVIISKKRTTLKSDFNPFLDQPTHIELEQTTFKIPPLTGEKMKPIPITEIDGQLRISDEKLFKEFLATMFNSQEIAEYEDIINPDNNDVEINDMIVNDETVLKEATTENIPEDQTMNIPVEEDTEAQEEVENQTQINEVTNKNLEEEENNKYEMNTPAIEEEPADVDKLNKDLANLLENVQDAGGAGPKGKEDKQTDNEKVLTLLYLSDDDKKSNGGLSIPTEHFEDLTRSKQNVLNILPENELYALLSEVIQDEVEKIKAGA